MAVLELVEEITTSINNNKYTTGIFVDLKKAFDTVNHDILAKKYNYYGIRGIAHTWILSYLANRSQYVQYDNCDSEVLIVFCCCSTRFCHRTGVVYFVHQYVSKILKFILFADDINMFCCDSNTNELVRLTNDELNKLRTWLSLNVLKTNYDFVKL